MQKITYLQKLAITQITDDNTVGEAKVAKRTETALKQFWKQAAIAHIRQNEEDGEQFIENPWIKLEFDFNLQPTGTVIVKVIDLDARNPLFAEVKQYAVPKRHLFN
jgi:hypothetical protein